MRLATLSSLCSLAFLVCVSSTALAETITAEGPVVYGHHHFNTTDMAAQKRFFVETLGGKLATIGTNNLEVIEFPNVFLFFRPMQAPTGGTIGLNGLLLGTTSPSGLPRSQARSSRSPKTWQLEHDASPLLLVSRAS